MNAMTWVLALAGIVLGYTLCWARSRAGLDKALDVLRSERTQMHERAVTAEATLKALKDQQGQMRTEFTNTATALLEQVSGKFTVQSEQKIGALLNPLRERLGEFQKKIDESFSTQGKEQHTLKAEIEKIVQMNAQMRMETSSLTSALRGDVKAQGNWGEVMLERILEESGLRVGEDYVLQGSEMKLTGEDGGRQQPDVIVKLPDGKHIIIDAKVSLVAYERYSSAEENARELHLKDFLRSVKAHVAGLEQRRYQDNDKLGTPDFVLMFLPVEGAYSLAVQSDRELHSYAWGKKIVLVCPATLFATLRTVASIWTIERQNRNAQEIARQGGALYDKFADFVGDLKKVGERLTQVQTTYDAAVNKLSTGRGNLISRVETLKELGVKPNKSLPKTEDEEAPLLSAAEG